MRKIFVFCAFLLSILGLCAWVKASSGSLKTLEVPRGYDEFDL